MGFGMTTSLKNMIEVETIAYWTAEKSRAEKAHAIWLAGKPTRDADRERRLANWSPASDSLFSPGGSTRISPGGGHYTP